MGRRSMGRMGRAAQQLGRMVFIGPTHPWGEENRIGRPRPHEKNQEKHRPGNFHPWASQAEFPATNPRTALANVERATRKPSVPKFTGDVPMLGIFWNFAPSPSLGPLSQSTHAWGGKCMLIDSHSCPRSTTGWFSGWNKVMRASFSFWMITGAWRSIKK